MRCSDLQCVTNHALAVRDGDITQSRAKSLVLRKLQLRHSAESRRKESTKNVP